MIKKWTTLIITLLTLVLTLFFQQPQKSLAQIVPIPTFQCLGSCPNSITPTQTPKPQKETQNSTSSQTKTQQNTTQQQKKYSNTPERKQTTQPQGFINQILDLLLQLINIILRVLGINSPTPTPPIPYTITPTYYPSITIPPSTTNPSPISIDDIRYTPGNEPLKIFNIEAKVVGDKWTYNGTIPGPEIRVNQGDHVRINLLNNLPESTVIHSHGIRLPIQADGVAGVTQNAVPPGQTFTYDYVVPDVGTYWYHSHQNTLEQVQKGLYGRLVVLPKTGQIYNHDYTVVYQNLFALGGNKISTIAASPGDKIRLRLVDVREPDFSGASVKAALIGAPFKVIATDGNDINEPQEIKNQLIPMGIAQRYDLEFTMPATGAVQLIEKENLQTFTFGEGEVADRPENLNLLPDFDFINYGIPSSDPHFPKTTFDLDYTMTIGQNLSINGKLGHEVPPLVVKKGQLVHIHFVNNSNMTHPMHIHGHTFSVLKRNEVALSGSPIYLDTLLVPPGETADIALYADNDGMWMFHCHILAHARLGLMMLLNYDNVYSPYEFGPGTINQPE